MIFARGKNEAGLGVGAGALVGWGVCVWLGVSEAELGKGRLAQPTRKKTFAIAHANPKKRILLCIGKLLFLTTYRRACVIFAPLT